jgi:beta-galactosidase
MKNSKNPIDLLPHSLSRRDMLLAGGAFSATTLFARNTWARAAAAIADGARAGSSGPREKLLMDFGWRFQLGHGSDPARDLGLGTGQGDFAKTGEFDFAKVKFDDSKWRAVQLPHDWAVELPFVRDEEQKLHGYKPLGRRYPETSVGWYRKVFDVPVTDRGRRINIEFDGAFRSVLVFVNGCFIGRNDNGYAPFHFDLTDFLKYGAKNAIAIRVDAAFGDGWFYEGAGIYRHIWLSKTDPLHIGRWDSFARTTLTASTATVNLSTLVFNDAEMPANARVKWDITDKNGKLVATAEAAAQTIEPDGKAHYTATARLTDPLLWSIDEPNLYTATVTIESDGAKKDEEHFTFGVRTAVFDADHGFSLNGKSVKIQGTCNHQDHAGVGAALPDRLQFFRMGVLKEMGSNAVRTSHNMPTPEWVEACDRMGMMMMCETRQMSSSEEGLAQIEAMVKRYRNSPSIILWSIGNEEWTLQDEEPEVGKHIAASMVRRIRELDPTRVVSAAVNGDNKQGLSESIDIIGFNYRLEFPDEYHKNHPKMPVYGSETASSIATRGEYTTDPLRNTLSAYDVNAVPWGEKAEEWWKYYGTREWMAGGFAWTGFDYRGEPTPYGWPSISSQFGIVDMCGYPKDSFYYYKAWWGKEPVLHLHPHWNFAGREGEVIPVWVHSNLDEVDLFLNGQSLGTQKVPHLGHVEWKVKYAPGTIEARGSKDGKVVLTSKRETTGSPATIRLTPDRAAINADGEDIALIKVEALDKEGRTVPTALNLISFKITGNGRFLGVGNGDPNCQESDKVPKRSLFNGLAQLIVQSTGEAGEIVIEAETISDDGQWGKTALTPTKLTIKTTATAGRPAVI